MYTVLCYKKELNWLKIRATIINHLSGNTFAREWVCCYATTGTKELSQVSCQVSHPIRDTVVEWLLNIF